MILNIIVELRKLVFKKIKIVSNRTRALEQTEIGMKLIRNLKK